MKNIFRLFFFISVLALFSSCSNASSKSSEALFQSGDIIFQTSQSAQCEAVRLATHSKYSHCAILFVENGEVMVYEAVQPVKITPFEKWIKHGKGNSYVVRRLKNASTVLTPEILSKMKTYSEQDMGKSYDIYFGWSDDKIYCSELVWKTYKEGADLEVGKLQKLKEFDLISGPVKEKLEERYGKNIPLEETVISPQSIFESDLLVTIEDTY